MAAEFKPGATIDLATPLGVVTVVRQLGRGSFGSVYEVEDRSGGTWAMKVETTTPQFSQLQYEYRVYAALAGKAGVPRVHAFRKDSRHRYLVMDRLGDNLHTVLMKSPARRLPLKYVCVVGIRILNRLEALHKSGFVHRDVKPQNFLLSAAGDPSDIWAVDFGLAKAYRDPSGNHIPYRSNKRGLTGTPRFASTFAQRGEENGRRDDLESLMYVLAFLYHGELPWQRRSRRGRRGRRGHGNDGYKTHDNGGRKAYDEQNERKLRNADILEAKLLCPMDTLYGSMGGLNRAAQYVRDLRFD